MRAAARDVALVLSVATAHRDDLLPLTEKEIAYREGLVEDAAGVPTEIEDQRLGALPAEVPHRVGELVGGGLVEGLERDVADVVVEHHVVLHGGDVNLRAREAMLDRLRDPRAREAHPHPRPDIAHQGVAHLRRGPSARAPRVHRDDAVPFLDARALRRRVGEDLHDGDVPLLILDLHPDPAVAAGGLGGETGELLRREELGIGVLELGDETACGLLVQRRGVDGVDEAIGDERQDLIEEASAFTGPAILDDEAADEERSEERADEEGLADARHGGTTEEVRPA